MTVFCPTKRSISQPPLQCVYISTLHVVVVTNSVYETVVAVLLSVQHAILDKDWDGSQDERHEQVHVNEVPGAVELPEEKREGQNTTHLFLFSLFITANEWTHLDLLNLSAIIYRLSHYFVTN